MNTARSRAASLSRRNLIVSVFLHVWFAAIAMQLVWKYWEAESERAAEAALIPPGGGGGGGTARAVRPKEKARAASRTKTEMTRVIALTPSTVTVQTRPAARSAPDRMSRSMSLGAGWQDTAGESLFPGEGGWGEGWGDGWGAGFIGSPIGLPNQKTKPPPSRSPVLVIILDVSPSMRVSAVAKASALAALQRQLTSLPADTPFHLVCFAGTVRSLSDEPLSATPENKAAALAFAQKAAVQPGGADSREGSSRLDLGMAEALRRNPGSILLISDGVPVVRRKGRSLTQTELLERIRSLLPEDGARPELHTVSPGSQESAFLRRLEAELGGRDS